MSEKIVAWHYNNLVDSEEINDLELFAENIGATFDIPFFKQMPKQIEVNIFVENTDFFNKELIEKELEKITKIKKELRAVYEHDWQKDCISDFPPIEIGSFFIHSFEENPKEKSKISLKIPAQMAFGTGEHSTTKGCLILYENLKNKGSSFKNVLDMGCGSSILAMAVYKKEQSNILAVDYDKTSIEVSEKNLIVNNIKDGISLLLGDGFIEKQVQDKVPYDLIFANIFKNPLIEMSEDLVKSLQKGGIAILSGFKEEKQSQEIIQRYVNELGLELIDEFYEDSWAALALRKN